jgi:hypothetical protein
MRLVPGRLAPWLPGRLSLRLGTMMVVVALLAIGLTFETNRLRREAREAKLRQQRLLMVIAETRSERVAVHRRQYEGAIQKIKFYQSWLDYIEGRGGSDQFSIGSGRYLPHDQQVSYLRSEIAKEEARAKWAEIMARNLEWAADHPSEPFPPAPPNPDMVGLPAVPTAVDQPEPPRGPAFSGRPAVPLVVKKAK